MPICCKTSSFSSVAGAIAGIGTVGTAPVGIGAAMHFAAGSAGAARGASAAGAFRPGDEVSIPAVPADLSAPVPAVLADLARWYVLAAVVLGVQQAAVAVQVAVDQVVEAVDQVAEAVDQVAEAGATVAEAGATVAVAVAPNGSIAS